MSVSATMSVFVSSHLRVDQEPLKLLQPLLRARAKNDLQGFLDFHSEKDLEYSNYGKSITLHASFPFSHVYSPPS